MSKKRFVPLQIPILSSDPSNPESNQVALYAKSGVGLVVLTPDGTKIPMVDLKQTVTATGAYLAPTGDARENELFVTNLTFNLKLGIPSGTPINGNKLIVRIKDDGNARTLAFPMLSIVGSDTVDINGEYYDNGIVNTKTEYINKNGYKITWNTGTTKWELNKDSVIYHSRTNSDVLGAYVNVTGTGTVSANNTNIYSAIGGLILPTNVDAGQTLYLVCIYNSSTSTWDVLQKYVSNRSNIKALSLSAGYTFALSDMDKYIRCNASTPVSLTIPTNANVAFPIGTCISVEMTGSSELQFVVASGVVLRTPTGAYIRTQYDVAQLVKVDTNEWTLIGAVS